MNLWLVPVAQLSNAKLLSAEAANAAGHWLPMGWMEAGTLMPPCTRVLSFDGGPAGASWSQSGGLQSVYSCVHMCWAQMTCEAMA